MAENCRYLNGRVLANKINENSKIVCAEIEKNIGHAPKLFILVIGSSEATSRFVSIKEKRGREIGIIVETRHLPKDIEESTLIQLIKKANEDPSINGIIIQLPLPPNIRRRVTLDSIEPSKDVDCLTSINMMNVMLRNEKDANTKEIILRPCTPQGIIELLAYYNIEVEKRHLVIIGRSEIVGLPSLFLMLKLDATITICHSKTSLEDLKASLRLADIVVISVGIPNFLKGGWLKPNCVLIDVGINQLEGSEETDGIVGDCDVETCKNVCSAISPVPGGVGPMTVAVVLRNTLKAAKIQHKID